MMWRQSQILATPMILFDNICIRSTRDRDALVSVCSKIWNIIMHHCGRRQQSISWMTVYTGHVNVDTIVTNARFPVVDIW